MITQQHLAYIHRADRDLYAREKVLNSAIIAADISSGWEAYLEIFDAFYADHVEVSDGTESGRVFGRERIRALLFKFLVPLHVMAEIGGLSACRYKYKRARFTQTPQMRHIRPGQWI